MILSDEWKTAADKLGLTNAEMAVALKARIPPGT